MDRKSASELQELMLGTYGPLRVMLTVIGIALPVAVMVSVQFNWLVMADPLNRTMLLGDAAIPDEAELRRHAAEGVRVFLGAYGRRMTPVREAGPRVET
jgi:hypothetical protein